MNDDLLVRTLHTLAREPSAVPLGRETLIEPDDPVLVRYVQQVLRPLFVEQGAHDIIDLPMNQFAARFGTGEGPTLALMAYTPTQHHNLMSDPWSGRIRTPIELGIDEPCLFGQGVTQNKAHQACLLYIAKRLLSRSEMLNGTLFLCINNEGRSSHQCSNAMLEDLPRQPDFVIQLFCSGFDIYIGNRGRVDIHVDVLGQASHSSTGSLSGNPLRTTTRVLHRIEQLDQVLRRNTHPILGSEHAVPYQVTFDPLAPHTLPNSAKIVVDRRLLPGTDPRSATEELHQALDEVDLAGCLLKVTEGVSMLPVLLSDEERSMTAPLDAATTEHFGAAPKHTTFGGSFDAGGPASRGIPTVMFGVADEGDILGDDFVRLSALRAEAEILYSTVLRFFGAQ